MMENNENFQNIGILAGDGALPIMIADYLKKNKSTFRVFTFELFSKQLEQFCPISCDISKPLILIGILKKLEIKNLIFAGSFMRFALQQKERIEKADSAYRALIQKNFNNGDDGFLSGVAEFFEGYGFKILGANQVLKNIVEYEERVMSVKRPTKKNIADIEMAIEIFKPFSELDIGQSLIVSNGMCMGLETTTGTDNMINNFKKYVSRVGGKLSKPGGVILKASKPGQDKRFDLPTIGKKTITLAYNAGLDGLVIESRNVIFIEKTKVIQLANSLGVFLWARNIND